MASRPERLRQDAVFIPARNRRYKSGFIGRDTRNSPASWTYKSY